jgi:hypothetical protein
VIAALLAGVVLLQLGDRIPDALHQVPSMLAPSSEPEAALPGGSHGGSRRMKTTLAATRQRLPGPARARKDALRGDPRDRSESPLPGSGENVWSPL